MKKFLVCMMTLCLCFSVALAQDRMVSEATALAERMARLAGNDVYRASMGISGEMGDIVKSFASGSRAEPRMILRTDSSELAPMVKALASMDDELLQEEMLRKMPSALLMQLVAYKGTAVLAAVSSVTTGAVFACVPEEKRGVFLLLYEDAVPVAVTWLAEKGAVQMNALFLPDEELAVCTSVQEVNAWFAGKGCPWTYLLTE